MKSNTDIRIFVSAHKETDILDNKLLNLIQVGTGMPNRKKIPGILHDNDSENISDKNDRFCELTAQYWAWKNVDADYYGFFHYRRYLAFKNEKFPTDLWGSVIESGITEDIIDKYDLSEEKMRKLIESHDIVLPKAKDITKMPKMGKNLREQYCGSGFLHEKDLDIMLNVIEEKYPEYSPFAKSYLAGKHTYLNNMFIMRKELFQKYSEWLFDILFECDKRIDFSDYSIEATRTTGHLAERLLNIFILHLLANGSYSIAELETVVFLNTDPALKIEPAFKSKNNAVALSANNRYSPFLATVITSIAENSSNDQNYDILVMHNDITPRNQQRMRSSIKNYDNISLRFINIARYQSYFQSLFLRGHFSIETWFRLLLPEVLANYKKVLYLDADLVVDADISELYKTNIDGYLLAACHDADTAGLYNGADKTKKKYMDTQLKLKNPYQYFQAGVLLLNLEEFRNSFTTKELLECASSKKWQLLDQDVLNVLCEDRVKYVDMAWNVMFDWNDFRIENIISLAPKYLNEEYMRAHNNPKIIHYAGPDKPWHQPLSDYAERFWHYARQTVFYEEIILEMNDSLVFGFFQKTKFKNRLKGKIIREIFPEDSRRRDTARRIKAKLSS